MGGAVVMLSLEGRVRWRWWGREGGGGRALYEIAPLPSSSMALKTARSSCEGSDTWRRR